MAMTYATVTGRIVIPGTTTGIPGELRATPLTDGGVLAFPAEDYTTVGPAVADVAADGTLTPDLQIPTDVPAGTLWRLVFHPKGKGNLPVRLGDYEISASADIADLVSVNPTVITPTMAAKIEEGVAALSGEDTAVAFLVEDTGSETHTALSATIATGLTSLPDTVATGVDPTGVTTSAAGLQALLDAHAGTDTIVRLQGTFNLGTTGITIACNLDARNAVFNYSGTGVAVQVGGSTYGQIGRLNVQLGEIINTGTMWQAGSVGLRIVNTFRSTISYQRVKDFAVGRLMVGDGTYGNGGVAYNTIHCGHLDNNLVNEDLQLVAGGTTPFVNENTMFGGSWSHSSGTYPVSGMRHIRIGTTGGGSLNNNRWIGASLEGQREEYILDIYGNDNLWIGCRWEFVSNPPPVMWRATAARNMILGGYAVTDLAQSYESGAVANNILGTQRIEFEAVGDGGVVLANASGGTNPMLTVMSSGWRRLGQTLSANYLFKLLTTGFKFKASGDTTDRLAYDNNAPAITFGQGVGTKKTTLTWGNAVSPEGTVTANPGSLYISYDTTNGRVWVKDTGTGNTGWVTIGSPPARNTAQFNTAGDPINTAGKHVGKAAFNSTTNRPVWATGSTATSTWVFADGTTAHTPA